MLSIIIVNYKSSQDLDICISSIMKNEKSYKKFEIIVVDNNSSDAGLKLITKKYPFVRIIYAEKNGGFAYGNNIGIEESHGDYIFLLNPDTWLDTPAISVLIDRLNNGDVDMVGPQLFFHDGSNQSYFLPKSYLTLWRLFCEQFYLHRIFRKFRVFNSYFRTYMDYSFETQVEQVSGAALMMKRSVIEKIGLLDDGYFMYFEESDFCLNAVRSGMRLFYCPESKIVHKGGLTDESKSEFSTACFYESFKRYFRKNFSVFTMISALFVLFSGTLIRTSVFYLSGNEKKIYYGNLLKNFFKRK